jgi:hypothetical protein
MTAEVEALLERLDDISSRSGHEWNAAKDAAVLIRAQVEEIYKWKELDRVTQSAFERELKRAEAAEAKLAAAARQELVAWFQKNEDGLYEQVGHQYAGDTGTVPLYAAPVPAGDAVSVRADVVSFLHGEGPLDGVHFGGRPDTQSGPYWWRKYLPESK